MIDLLIGLVLGILLGASTALLALSWAVARLFRQLTEGQAATLALGARAASLAEAERASAEHSAASAAALAGDGLVAHPVSHQAEQLGQEGPVYHRKAANDELMPRARCRACAFARAQLKRLLPAGLSRGTGA